MTVFLLSVAGSALITLLIFGLVWLEGWATNSNEKQP